MERTSVELSGLMVFGIECKNPTKVLYKVESENNMIKDVTPLTREDLAERRQNLETRRAVSRARKANIEALLAVVNRTLETYDHHERLLDDLEDTLDKIYILQGKDKAQNE